MPSVGIVPGLDEGEHGHSGLGLIPEALSFDQLGLEGGEEALAHHVVVGVTDRAQRSARNQQDARVRPLPQDPTQKVIHTPPLNDLPSSGAHTSVIQRPSGVCEGRSSGSKWVWRVSKILEVAKQNSSKQKRFIPF